MRLVLIALLIWVGLVLISVPSLAALAVGWTTLDYGSGTDLATAVRVPPESMTHVRPELILRLGYMAALVSTMVKIILTTGAFAWVRWELRRDRSLGDGGGGPAHAGA
jgi:hypothetical protein